MYFAVSAVVEVLGNPIAVVLSAFRHAPAHFFCVQVGGVLAFGKIGGSAIRGERVQFNADEKVQVICDDGGQI